MFNAILTLLSSLSLATVVGWFSIAGIVTIYAGAPFHAALIMGIVTECSKLITLSWLYRNWKYASIFLRAPLIALAIIVMIITNIGVFGFLSKAHLEQGAATVDNTAKVEQLNQQISREQSRIADNDKIIAQMDGAVTSFIGKDQANRSLTVRKSQANQRKQLRDEIETSQKIIDDFNEQKFTLESEVRKLQLEVGPIRYVSEIFNKNGDEKSIESTVQIFTLLIVLILDPAAVMLLLAANSSLSRLKNEKDNLHKEIIDEEKEIVVPEYEVQEPCQDESPGCEIIHEEDIVQTVETIDDTGILETKAQTIREEIRNKIYQTSLDEDAIVHNFGYARLLTEQSPPAYTIINPNITKVIRDEKLLFPEGIIKPSMKQDKKIKTLSWLKEFSKE